MISKAQIKWLFLLITLLSTGCANLYYKDDVGTFDVKSIPQTGLLDVDRIDLGQDKNGKPIDYDYTLSDKKILKFTNLIKDTLTKKERQGRVGEEIFAGLQVTLAAFGAAFASGTGVHPDLVTGLSGLSALMPDVADIINAGEKSKAYGQALTMVESAEAQYYKDRVAKKRLR